MKLRKLFFGIFVVVLLISCIFAKKSGSSSSRSSSSRGSSSSSSSGSSSSSSHRNSKTTSRPHTTHSYYTKDTYDWDRPKSTTSRPRVTHNPYEPPKYDSVSHTESSHVKQSGNHDKIKPSSISHQQHSSNSGSYNPSYNPSAPVDHGHNTPHYNNPSYNNPSHYNSHSNYPTQNVYQPHPAYQPYNPSYGHSSVPGAGYNPPVGHAPTTVLVQQSGSSDRSSIGQIAKEAVVYSVVNAGVKAAINRILPGGISGNRHNNYNHGHDSSQTANSNGVVPTVTNTHIVNNYYNNGTSVPASQAAVQTPKVNQPASQSVVQPAQTFTQSSGISEPGDYIPPVVPIGAPENINNMQNSPPLTVPEKPFTVPEEPFTTTEKPLPAPAVPAAPATPAFDENTFPSPSGGNVTKAEVHQLTEDLFTNDKNNVYQYISMNLQGKKTDDSTTDDAPGPLLVVDELPNEAPTIRNVYELYDSFALDVKEKETQNAEKYQKINNLLDSVIATDVMNKTMSFLSEKGFLPAGTQEYEYKDILRGIWFSLFKRTDGEAGSCGFETIFLAEKFDSEIIGMHNWIYYEREESLFEKFGLNKQPPQNINYLGYIKETKLGTKGAIVKVRSSLNDIVQPVSTIFVGTSPELEMALYTMCFYVRPNVPCPIKLGGTEFIIISNAINYYGRDILISGFPEI